MKRAMVGKVRQELQSPCASADCSMTPVRINLFRAKGWRLQEASMAINGLAAVKVDRTTKWGNPWTLSNTGRVPPVLRFACETAPLWDVSPLRGKNLACWCGADDECRLLSHLRASAVIYGLRHLI